MGCLDLNGSSSFRVALIMPFFIICELSILPLGRTRTVLEEARLHESFNLSLYVFLPFIVGSSSIGCRLFFKALDLDDREDLPLFGVAAIELVLDCVRETRVSYL